MDWSQWFSQPQSRVAITVIIGMIAVALLSRWSASANTTPQYSTKFVKQLKRVVSQASKWHTTARQDSDPMISLIHANYALAYANVARALAPESGTEQLLGIRLNELIYYLEADQKRALQSLASQYPGLKPSGIYTTGNAWM
jgi:hypothetical protein